MSELSLKLKQVQRPLVICVSADDCSIKCKHRKKHNKAYCSHYYHETCRKRMLIVKCIEVKDENKR
jgi:hypothetical protein